MSLEAILAEIEAAGEAEVVHLRQATQARARQILVEAERAAATKREAARRVALAPAAGERARRLHAAKLEALRVLGEVRNRLIETTLAEARLRLSTLRADPGYPVVLRHLVEEAIGVLGDEGANGNHCLLEADARDEKLLRRILAELGLDRPLTPALTGWGGLIARSEDGKVVAVNTLEARLERATPFLRRELAAFFEKELGEAQTLKEHAAHPPMPVP
jgi:vacuolar-type H+-ATPase subunit E/Vma4